MLLQNEYTGETVFSSRTKKLFFLPVEPKMWQLRKCKFLQNGKNLFEAKQKYKQTECKMVPTSEKKYLDQQVAFFSRNVPVLLEFGVK